MNTLINSPRTSATAAALFTLIASASAQTYDVQATLAGQQPTPPNPAGVFSFGRYATNVVDPNTFSIFTTLDENIAGTGMDAFYTGGCCDPNVLYNDTGASFTGFGFTLNDGEVAFGPAGGPAVIRFTAPSAGDYQISSSFLGIQNQNAEATAFVFQNATQLFTEAADNTDGASFASTVTLAANDTIDFVAGNGTRTTRFAGSLTVVPEPTSLALLGSAGVALLVNRRRRA